ncbi:S8 family serine peptidase [Niabella beijingensis]|uniref:S8 family serine peptidase n=1 Tax=Niabella beijingensis TaxID=2872700 RepID=UPI0023E470F6|nr:S8 family serine peptidase [Niabella beijingensis]MBZ4187644.1 S8 family serine peptidase [Niabella beijingensis]
MKTKFIFISVLVLMIISCSKRNGYVETDLQTTARAAIDVNPGLFYYSAKEKKYLTEDSSVIVLKTPLSEEENAYNELQSDLAALAVERMTKTDVGTIEIQLKGNNIGDVINKIKSNLKEVNVWHSLKLGSLNLIPTGEILLKPKKGNSISEILSKVNYSNGASIKEDVNKYGTAILDVKDRQNLFPIANAIYESGLVEWSHPNFWVPISKNYSPTDFYYGSQFYLKNRGWQGGTIGMDINVEPAWDITKGSSSIKIAVIDDGVEAHEDLPSSRILSGYTPRNASGYGAPTAASAHGECVAGIIAATQDNDNPSASLYTISGIAPNCKIVPVNIFYDGYETVADLASAINWAWDNGGADVLSNSWNYNSTSGPILDPSFDALVQSFTDARTLGRGGKGSVVVFSSGNYGPSQPTGVRFPANLDGIITVGAVDMLGRLSTYTCQGPSMDLVAVSSYELFPLGDVFTIDRMGDPGYVPGPPVRPYFAGFGGTSAACPQVSGVAALMLSAKSTLTESQVKSILQSTAVDMGSSGFDNQYGYGRVNAGSAVYQASITP